MKIVEKHPSGSDIIFIPEGHRYFLDGIPLTSVTTFVSKFFPKFDTEFVSEKYAQKYGLDQEKVKQDWKQEGEQATLLGDNCHEYADALINNKKLIKPLNKKEKNYFNSINNYLKYLFITGFEPFKTEYIIASRSLRIAGAVDLIFIKGNTIYIKDWKTNKAINTYNTFQSALDPISHLDDCLFNKYSLQLNLYRCILETDKYFVGKEYDITIAHVTQEGVIELPVPDMSKELKKMLTF